MVMISKMARWISEKDLQFYMQVKGQGGYVTEKQEDWKMNIDQKIEEGMTLHQEAERSVGRKICPKNSKYLAHGLKNSGEIMTAGFLTGSFVVNMPHIFVVLTKMLSIKGRDPRVIKGRDP